MSWTRLCPCCSECSLASGMKMERVTDERETRWQGFNKIQNTKMSMKWDGIGSVRYRVLEVSRQPLFTNITVDIGQPMSWLTQG